MCRVRFRSLLIIACLLTTAALPTYVPAQSLSSGWITVTNTNDSGSGSLRAAITTANACKGSTKVIRFNIGGGGARAIYLASPLPPITCRVHINGYWQPGSAPNSVSSGDNRVINIGLKAAYLTQQLSRYPATCLQSSILNFRNASGSSVRGIAFDNAQSVYWPDPNSCAGAIVGISTSSPISIVGNTFGLWPEGNGGNLLAAIESSAQAAVVTTGEPLRTQIGGYAPADRNIAAASSVVIDLLGSSSGVSITNNVIGFDPATGSRASGTAIRCGKPVTPGHCLATDVTIEQNVLMTPAGIEMYNAAPRALSDVLIGNNYFGLVPWDSSIQPAIPLNRGLFISGNSRNNYFEDLDNSVFAGTVVADNAFHGFGTAIELQQNSLGTPRVLFSGNSIGNSTNTPILMVGGTGDALVNDVLDADTGPNDLQNFPVIGAVDSAGNVSGTLESAPNQSYRIELFANSSCHPFGYGEAERVWFAFDVVTDGNGAASFEVAAPYSLTTGEYVTAMATAHATGQSSAISACTIVQ